MTTTTIARPAPTDLLMLEESLNSVFVEVQAAIGAGEDVALVVCADDLLGHRSPEQAAFANALVGMARAVAFEGVKPGWRINVVAVPSPTTLDAGEVEALLGSERLSGQVLTLGTGLVGRLLP